MVRKVRPDFRWVNTRHGAWTNVAGYRILVEGLVREYQHGKSFPVRVHLVGRDRIKVPTTIDVAYDKSGVEQLLDDVAEHLPTDIEILSWEMRRVLKGDEG